MKLKDIVNRDLVTLTNCESEPIHIPGAIQPHGFLLALKGEELLVDFCSGNAAAYCGANPEQFLGKSFAQCFGAEQTSRLKDYLAGEAYQAGDPVALTLGHTAYSCTVRPNIQGLYVLEAEPFPDGSRSLPELYQQTRMFVGMLERTQTLKELCQTIAEETRAITGYDRVMIYRFDKDYNGEVFAEAKREDLEPFLNLHYPHTDIPVQARELYLRNLLRVIVDVNYQPVPIYTLDDEPGKNLDLSHSILRSVSPIHIEYLKNMGVGATLTISLVHERRLWGLIACHHYAPKNIPHYTRLSAQLQGHFLTSQIAVRETSEVFEAGKEITAALNELLPLTSKLDEWKIPAFIDRTETLGIVGATGVALKFDEQLYVNGEVPSPNHIEALADWLRERTADTFSTDRLGDLYEGVTNIEHAAGILYQSLSGDGAQYIIWFRQEYKKEVIWAGDPTKAIVKDEKGLSPRKSFEQWCERTSGQSKPWTQAELAAATNLAHALQKQLSYILLSGKEQGYRLLSEQLQLANDELERINWISTHDLQEPLRKIQVFASRLLSSPEAAGTDNSIIHTVERMSAAANRMQALVTDIHSYSRLLHKEMPLEKVALEEIVDSVMSDLAEEIQEKGASITKAALPEINGEPFLLRQVFTNLLRNALKFARQAEPLRVEITAQYMRDPGYLDIPRRPDGYHRIAISDNGIGFDNTYAESIFGLFKRLHTYKEYSGTGIGLALCRKVMMRHKGFINAEGKPGGGATFYLWFPA